MSLPLERLSEVIERRIPYISGTVDLPAESTKLFFFGGDTPGPGANYVDLVKPTDDQLSALVKSCQPATFGRNKEDVLDETYRKAGKLDASEFSMNLDLIKLGLLEKVSRLLLMDGRRIRGELYKLNVYGPGSFFKSHKDTPRDTTMFGSLVLVLPIPHEGGELALRDDDQETRYDSSAILAQQAKPSVGYIAFYGDVEHEVLPVTSGNRVTLTYNLFFDSAANSFTDVTPAVQHPLVNALKDLLDDPDFLPQGGTLGYGLKYQYPVTAGALGLYGVERNLKGEDALVARVCSTLNLSTTIKVIYRTKDRDAILRSIALSSIPDMGDSQYDYEMAEVYEELSGRMGAIEVRWEGDYSQPSDDWMPRDDRDDEYWGEEIHWFTQPRFNGAKISYVAYGNEATMRFEYGCCCLFITVDSYEARK